MSRPLRIEFEGALYHVTARGNRQESIFYGDDDRTAFLRILGQVISRCQQLVGRSALGELFPENQDKSLRNQTIKIAHLDYSCTLKEIADHVGRHYSTISRIVSA